eukprot:1162944-Pleurochrysis_carterae.AAC.1
MHTHASGGERMRAGANTDKDKGEQQSRGLSSRPSCQLSAARTYIHACPHTHLTKLRAQLTK